ncbi:hypothetical protein ACWD26_33100 [Streptomyces sp. NPDC002787]
MHRIGDGRVAVPLRLSLDGESPTDVELALSRVDAEHLHAALCRDLDGHPAPADAPDCRQPVQTSRGSAHIVGRA